MGEIDICKQIPVVWALYCSYSAELHLYRLVGDIPRAVKLLVDDGHPLCLRRCYADSNLVLVHHQLMRCSLDINVMVADWLEQVGHGSRLVRASGSW